MAQTPYTRLTTAGFTSMQATAVSALFPYQIQQLADYLNRVNWGDALNTAGNVAGKGGQSDISNQPTMAQILTMVGANNV